MALIAVSYTCYNDKNRKDCDTVARASDDIEHLRKTIEKIKKNHPKASIGILPHVALEYNPLFSLY